MKAIDQVGVTFINTVLGRGIFNGVVNITLGVTLFTPNDETNKIDPDVVVASRLRMDKLCAQELHAALGDLLAIIEKAETDAAAGVAPHDEPVVGKPN